MLAGAVAAYSAAAAGHATSSTIPIGGAGVVLVVVALLGVWEGGLVAGPALLLTGYAVSLRAGHHALDFAAPVVAAALIALIDLSSWSLELRENSEVPPLHHVRTLFALAIAAVGASAAVLITGEFGSGGGVAVWLVGAVAAGAILAIIPKAHAASAARRSQ